MDEYVEEVFSGYVLVTRMPDGWRYDGLYHKLGSPVPGLEINHHAQSRLMAYHGYLFYQIMTEFEVQRHFNVINGKY